jgi:hypothetical protein
MTLYPIEVKKTAMPGGEAVKNFSVLKKLGKQIGTGAVLCLGQEYMPINREAVSIPVWAI